MILQDFENREFDSSYTLSVDFLLLSINHRVRETHNDRSLDVSKMISVEKLLFRILHKINLMLRNFCFRIFALNLISRIFKLLILNFKP